jgi:hypothetical protein
MNKTIILALFVTITLAACSPVYTGPTSAPKVAVVGDSITLQSSESVQVAFYGKRLAIMAENGIDLSAGRTKFVQPAVKSKPAVLVIELGVNSAKDGWTSADLVPLEGIMSDVASVPCVVWVRTYTWRTTARPSACIPSCSWLMACTRAVRARMPTPCICPRKLTNFALRDTILT